MQDVKDAGDVQGMQDPEAKEDTMQAIIKSWSAMDSSLASQLETSWSAYKRYVDSADPSDALAISNVHNFADQVLYYLDQTPGQLIQ